MSAPYSTGAPLVHMSALPAGSGGGSSTPSSLHGWDFWRSINSPRFVTAPMVDQSELAFRSLTRKLGAELCYTPMLHARLFSEISSYREVHFDALPGEGPLFGQLAGHDPNVVVHSAKLIESKVSAVDLNFGCPQAICLSLPKCRTPICAICPQFDPRRSISTFGWPQAIARKGRYGAFLLEEPETVVALVDALARSIAVPVTAKVRGACPALTPPP